MKDFANDKKRIKNIDIIYGVFKTKPFECFDVGTLTELVNKDMQVMDKSTVYSLVRKLLSEEKIVCSDVIKGTKKYELFKEVHCSLICKACGKEKLIEINNNDSLYKTIHSRYGFNIEKGFIKLYGICKEAY